MTKTLADACEYVIWSNVHLDYENWRGDLESAYPHLSEDKRMTLMYEMNADYLQDERSNLNIQLSNPIIVIADLGLWNGRRSAYKMIDSGNIRDCLYSDCDSAKWYVDGKGDLCCDAHHHDGVNYCLYRELKGTANQQERLCSLIYNGECTQKDIDKYSKRLGDTIGRVYGWAFPQPQREPQRTTAAR